MKVARQFIAWNPVKRKSRPGGHGMTHTPRLFVALIMSRGGPWERRQLQGLKDSAQG